MSTDHRQPVALNLIPRPGDELLGLPQALSALEEQGWQTINVLIDAGADKKQQERAARQAEKSSLLMDSMLLQLQQPVLLPLPVGVDQDGYQSSPLELLEDTVYRSIEGIKPALVVSTGPQERDPAGQEIGRVVMRSIEKYARYNQLAPSWWIWSSGTGGLGHNYIWGYSKDKIGKMQKAAAEYKDRQQLGESMELAARLRRIHAPAGLLDDDDFYAELWMDVHLCDDWSWRPGSLRNLDPLQPLPQENLGDDIRNWLQALPDFPMWEKPLIRPS